MRATVKQLVLAASMCSASASAIDISGTIFDKAAKEYGLDPLLVYSVALAESAFGHEDGSISPWPWTLRTPDLPFYAKNSEQAKEKLAEFQQQYGRAIDVGFMQVNIRWHGHRVSNPTKLLDPETNVMVGTKVLAETINSSPNDLELGIGRYHAWKDEVRSRNYGSRVLAIYRNLRDL
ncbi:lytic transglycosylase domain-containing protein [Photorhabdus caribbeanensis]|nr:transglycosylase SLT domain-containing protein [Photorhabdus caribbeanensis]MBS9424221.1 lytic transglycosylase domain-containing protein [Photorhabdus caribbeanensis]